MVRIEQGPTGLDLAPFMLKGMEQGAAIASRQREEEERAARFRAEKQHQAMMLFAEEMQQAEKDRAKMLQQAAASQDMEKAQRAMGLAQQIQAGSRKPSEKLMSLIPIARGRIQDPKALALFDEAAASVIGESRRQEGYQAAGGEIERAVKDGLLDETAAQSLAERLKAKSTRKESADDLLTELSKARMDRAQKATNIKENQPLYDKTRAYVEAMPDGEEKRQAMILLSEYENSPSRQEEQGSAAKLLAAVQKEGPKLQPAGGGRNPNLSARRAAIEMWRKDNEGEGRPPTEQELGPYMRALIPQEPIMVKGEPVDPQGIKAVTLALLEESDDPETLYKRMKDQGVPITEAVVQYINEALMEFRANARGQ